MAVTNKMTPEQQLALAQVMQQRNIPGTMNFPGVREAYKADPRTGLAADMLARGSSGAPVAEGGWAWAEGLSRLGNAIAGGITTRQQKKKYEALSKQGSDTFETAYAKMMAAQQPPNAAGTVAAQGVQPNVAPASTLDDPNLTTARALSMQNPPGQVGATNVNPTQPPVVNRGQLVPSPRQSSSVPTATGSSVKAPRVLQPGQSARAENIAVEDGGTQVAAAPAADLASVYRTGILGAGENSPSRNGRFQVSPKGAFGPAQLMPGTDRAMAAKVGPQRAGESADDYNIRKGQQYYNDMVARYNGDTVKAAAAYNARPGRVDRWQRLAAANGGDWKDYIHIKETKDYVNRFTNATGGGNVAAGGAGGEQQDWAVPEMAAEPEAPTRPEIPQSAPSKRRLLAEALMGSGNADLMFPLMQDYLGKGMEEEADLNKQREENVAQMLTTEYQTDRQTFNQMRANLQRAGLDERQAYIAANIALRQQREENVGKLDEQRLKNEAAAAKAQATGGKPLPKSLYDTLENTTSTLNTMLNLTGTYRDDFFGKGTGWLGDMQNWIKERTGDPQYADQVSWWKQYNSMVGIVRNKLYGSALTETEKQLWDKTDINPGTNPAQARANLERRLQIFQNALARHSGAASSVYNKDEIDALTGGPDMQSALQSRKPLHIMKTDFYGRPIANQTGFAGGKPGNLPKPTPQQKADDAYLNQKYGL